MIQKSKSDYLYEVDPGHIVIDAEDPESCYARYANDNDNDELNAELIPIPLQTPYGGNWHLGYLRGRGMLRAIKDIYADQEIFCAYGDNYWSGKIKR